MPIEAQVPDDEQHYAPKRPLSAVSHRLGKGERSFKIIWPQSISLSQNGLHKRDKNGNGPFLLSVQQYYAADFAPFPLPAGKKKPPPAGCTGYGGKRATVAQINQWRASSKYEDGNIAVALSSEVFREGFWYQLVGIDVDQYDNKTGGDQLRYLENQLEPLPDTWISGARNDGTSGIRWFLAPTEITFHDKADTNIEIIQRHHRFAVVWPSVHPSGETYWWFPPGVTPDDAGRTGDQSWKPDDGLPALYKLPLLPNKWVTYLTRGATDNDHEIDWTLPASDLRQWAEDEFNSGLANDACWNISSAIDTWKRNIDEDESSHDKINDAIWMIYNLARVGHTGWKDAANEIENYWLNDVIKRKKRSLSEAEAEIARDVIGALRKIKPQVDAKPVPQNCDCVDDNGKAKFWHPASAPLKVARQLALIYERKDTPLIRWRNDWYIYENNRYKMRSSEALRNLLYDALGEARYWNVKANGDIPWNPNTSKVTWVEDALRSVDGVSVDDEINMPAWVDGCTDQVISLKNTLLRISDRKQIDHTPKYFNTLVLPFDYDSVAPMPSRWLKFLSELWPDDPESIALLQEWFGYVISQRMDQDKILMLLGSPRTGKSTIVHILKQLVGEYNCCGPSADSLCENFGKAPLIGKALAVIDEMAVTKSGKKFVSILKEISGNGSPSIPRKHKDEWYGNLGVRFMLVANQRENLPGAACAIIGRMLVLETTIRFDKNPDINLRQKLETELPGILNWALDGLDRLNEQGRFTRPESTQWLVDEMNESSSPIIQFFGDEDVFTFKSENYVARKQVYKMWCDWCERNNFNPGNVNTFLAKVRAAYGTQIVAEVNTKRIINGKQERVLLGVGLTKSARKKQDFFDSGFIARPVTEPVTDDDEPSADGDDA